ncbi:MAG: acetyl-CoA C-acetyltransferase [Alphaproteobacteria bacterium]|nr:acetyl-CoA C-acetyltransferase [Alphaproteobacteria bacterium]
MPKDIVIVSAARTPVGSFSGSLSELKAHQLGGIVLREVLERAHIAPEDVSEVIMGQVLTTGQGQNPARQASISAGFPVTTPASCINQVCGSGLRAVALGLQAIQTETARIVIAGGQESMSQTPHCAFLRKGKKMGEVTLVDTMIKDGLWDAFNDYHMGNTAENIAKQYHISRDQQDDLAVSSQNKAENAQKNGFFEDEIVTITLREGKKEIKIAVDEYIRHGVTLEKINHLRPVFEVGGTVTAGNASGINDGAAALLLMTAEDAEKRNLQPLARIVSWAQAGVAPEIMGIGAVPAAQEALKKAKWDVGSLDLIEANEAFAAQSIAVNKEIGWDVEKVNVNGGAIAIGHPIGASGCRILVTLLYEMSRRKVKKGIATLCIGGGMGLAMCIARD